MTPEEVRNRVIADITALTTVRENLSVLFDESENLYPAVRDKLLEIADFLYNKFLISITSAEIKDVVIYQEMASYLYTPQSPIDLLIIVNDFTEDEKLTRHILDIFSNSFYLRGFRFTIKKHLVRFRITLAQDIDGPAYSVQKQCWLQKPEKKQLSVSLDEVLEQYFRFNQEIHDYIDTLPRNDEDLLTREGCEALDNYLNSLRQQALAARRNNPEHEYCLPYILFQCITVCGVYSHFRKYLSKSHNHLLRYEND